MGEEKIGIISHYYNKIGVATIVLEGGLSVGDTIHIKGSTTDFTQKIDSMQLEHNRVETATAGNHIGIRVNEYAREGDIVYKAVDK